MLRKSPEANSEKNSSSQPTKQKSIVFMSAEEMHKNIAMYKTNHPEDASFMGFSEFLGYHSTTVREKFRALNFKNKEIFPNDTSYTFTSVNDPGKKPVITTFKNYKHESIALMSATEFLKRLNSYFEARYIRTLQAVSDFNHWNKTSFIRKLRDYDIQGKEIFTSEGMEKLKHIVKEEKNKQQIANQNNQDKEKTLTSAKAPVKKSSIHDLLASDESEISQTTSTTTHSSGPLAESAGNSKKRQRDETINENINWVYKHPHKRQLVLFPNDNSYPHLENQNTFTPLNKK